MSSFAILRKSVAHLLVASAELEADLVGEDLVSVDGAAAWTHEAWVHVMDISATSSMVAVTVVLVAGWAAAVGSRGHCVLVSFEDIILGTQLSREVSITVVVSA